MAAPRLLVFDLDGTLIDSSRDLCNAVNAALQHVHRSTLPDAIIASYIGDGAATLVRRALAVPDATHPSDPAATEALLQQTYAFFLDFYREHKLDNTRCYDGVIEALQNIRAAHPHLPMDVLTNKPVNPSRDICRALALAPFFFENYGGNSFPTKKPVPEGLLHLIAEANELHPSSTLIQQSDAVMIGDSDVDILTARAAGARSLGCTFGLAPAALAASHPDTTVDHPSQWQSALSL